MAWKIALGEPGQWQIFGVDLRFVLLAETEMLGEFYPILANPIVYWLAKLSLFGFPTIIWLFVYPLSWFGFYEELKASHVLLSVLSIGLTIFLCEATLRFAGYYPGQLSKSRWFKPVDELYSLRGFSTDSDGIFKVDTAFCSFLKKAREADECEYFELLQSPDEERFVAEITSVFRQHSSMVYSNRASPDKASCKPIELVFKRMLDQQSILGSCYEATVNHKIHTDFDSLILRYVNEPINEEGFYSIPFEEVPERKKVLLIGDSFTYGHSAKSLGNSFSNILLSKGYLVYNTGISGADLAQYVKVAEKYIGRLKPDVVIVNFFMGNDISWHRRIPDRETPLFFATNAGNLLAFQDGREYRDMRSAYEAISYHTGISKDRQVDRLLSGTVIGTLIWKATVARLPVLHQDPLVLPIPKNEDYCYDALTRISSICELNEAEFILSVIPELADGQLVGADSQPLVFRDMNVFEANLSPEMYSAEDGHFNDFGHKVYANQLIELLDKD